MKLLSKCSDTAMKLAHSFQPVTRTVCGQESFVTVIICLNVATGNQLEKIIVKGTGKLKHLTA